jgi:hypothetical protein
VSYTARDLNITCKLWGSPASSFERFERSERPEPHVDADASLDSIECGGDGTVTATPRLP